MPDDGITLCMEAAAAGDRSAGDRLLALVYDQLRGGARKALARERPDHTLSATALVHEAYLRLVGPRTIPWRDRAHFYAAAAEAMRRILIDHARARARRPRREALPVAKAPQSPSDRAMAQGAAGFRLNHLEDVAQLAAADAEQIVGLDEALQRLERTDSQAASIVRLRFYAGLSVEDTAAALGLAPRTCARMWAYARAVLYRDLSGHEATNTPEGSSS